MIHMQIRAHGLDVLVHQRMISAQLRQLVDTRVVRDAQAVEAVELVVCGDGFWRGGKAGVRDEAFSFWDEGGPGVLGVGGWWAGEVVVQRPDAAVVAGGC